MRLVQVAQFSSDLDRSSEFYSALLDARPVARFDPPGLLFFDLGTTRLMLESRATPALIYLDVDLITTALDRIAAHTQPHVIFRHDDDRHGPAGTDEWQAFVTDPDGNLVGLVEFRASAGTQ